ncbi:hypothetical protein TPA0909_21610 [Streptomyces albus]|nr:hypothetical protein TPA0909_21610 [Streptomyces albus]
MQALGVLRAEVHHVPHETSPVICRLSPGVPTLFRIVPAHGAPSKGGVRADCGRIGPRRGAHAGAGGGRAAASGRGGFRRAITKREKNAEKCFRLSGRRQNGAPGHGGTTGGSVSLDGPA